MFWHRGAVSEGDLRGVPPTQPRAVVPWGRALKGRVQAASSLPGGVPSIKVLVRNPKIKVVFLFCYAEGQLVDLGHVFDETQFVSPHYTRKVMSSNCFCEVMH